MPLCAVRGALRCSTQDDRWAASGEGTEHAPGTACHPPPGADHPESVPAGGDITGQQGSPSGSRCVTSCILVKVLCLVEAAAGSKTPHVSLLGVHYRVMPLPVYWLVIRLPRYSAVYT